MLFRPIAKPYEPTSLRGPRTRQQLLENETAGFLSIEGALATQTWKRSSIRGAGLAEWTRSIAVGSDAFIQKIKEALGFRARASRMRSADDDLGLRQTTAALGMTTIPEPDNTSSWDR